LIRHKITHAFFSQGQWVEDVRQAQEFKDYNQVFAAEAKYKLRDVEIYRLYKEIPDPFLDWTIPLS